MLVFEPVIDKLFFHLKAINRKSGKFIYYVHAMRKVIILVII